MKKSIFYRLFGIGSMPAEIRDLISREGILASEEGIKGWFIAKNAKGPGKRFIHKRRGFVGYLALTSERLILYFMGRRQINIAFNNPGFNKIRVNILEPGTLSVSFESSEFLDGWEGVFEYRIKTGKAQQFYDILVSRGALESG